jgi:hypothetical protein
MPYLGIRVSTALPQTVTVSPLWSFASAAVIFFGALVWATAKGMSPAKHNVRTIVFMISSREFDLDWQRGGGANLVFAKISCGGAQAISTQALPS